MSRTLHHFHARCIAKPFTSLGVSALVLAAAQVPAHGALTLQLITGDRGGGLNRPVFATAPAGDESRLFFLEQHTGAIKIMNLADHSIESTPFLTRGGLSTGSEQGLLGLAFHPQYEQNGQFFINFTDSSGDTNIVRYTVSQDDPNIADAASATPILSIDQASGNHNGGWMAFNPAIEPDQSQYLYIGSGDGGGAFDTGGGHTAGTGNAQDVTDNLLGKMLRIDVDGDDFPADANRNYAIPHGNPLAAEGVTGDDEIWAFGLRNPWRNSFDRANGDLYIADVGQNTKEEINYQPADSIGGENYGWRLREGTIETPSAVGGDRPPGNVDPIHDYDHFGGNRSVTGGYVYRGAIEEIQGHYFFAEFLLNEIWSFVVEDGEVTQFTTRTEELEPSARVSVSEIVSFAEDDTGEMYVLTLGGSVFKVVLLGDMDGNGVLDAFDVDDFELALADQAAYESLHPDIDPDVVGDLDASGGLDAFDTALFEAALAGNEAVVPEPAAVSLMGLGAIGLLRRRTR